MDLDRQLANEHAREQRAHDISELERPDPHTPKQEAERERQEDCELRILSERRDNIRDHAPSELTDCNTWPTRKVRWL
jgi:hypothetical protein